MLLIRDPSDPKDRHPSELWDADSAAASRAIDVWRTSAADSTASPPVEARPMKGRAAAGRTSRSCGARELDRAAAEYVEGTDRAWNLDFICEACRPRLVRYFRRKRVPESDAEDLTQETLIRVSAGLKDFRGDCPVLAYIFRIAANVRNRWLRDCERDRSQISLDQDESLGEQPEPSERTPEEKAARLELLDLIEQELGKLPPKMRACLELRNQGLSYREIAEISGSKTSTVGVNIKNAKDRLKKVLGNYLDMNEMDFDGLDDQDPGRMQERRNHRGWR